MKHQRVEVELGYGHFGLVSVERRTAGQAEPLGRLADCDHLHVPAVAMTTSHVQKVLQPAQAASSGRPDAADGNLQGH